MVGIGQLMKFKALWKTTKNAKAQKGRADSFVSTGRTKP
jgi:hypothetical protein